MFALRDYIDVVEPNVQGMTLAEVLNNCKLHKCGIRVDLAGVKLIDAPVNGKYTINVTLCNGKVLPNPVIRKISSAVFHDKSCIKSILSQSVFATKVRMLGDTVCSFESDSCLHIALPEREMALRIAASLEVHDELQSSGSINAAIACFFTKQLPSLKVCSPSMLMLNKTAFVFSTGARVCGTLRSIDIRRCYTNALIKDQGCWLHFSVLDEIQRCDDLLFLKTPGRYWVKTANYFPLKGDGWYYSTLLCYAHGKNIRFTAHYVQKASVLYPSFLFRAAVQDCKNRLSDADAKVVVNRFVGMLKTKPFTGRTSAAQTAFVTSKRCEADAFLSLQKGSYRTIENGMHYCRRPVPSIAMDSSRHFYDQVIERAWIMVHDLWLYMQAHGGTLVSVKTDSVTASFSAPLCMSVDESIFREEDPPCVLPPEATFGETIPEPALPSQPEIVSVGASHEFDSEPMCIIGRAGTGKSLALSRILKANEHAHIISPTNRAAAAFGCQGVTVHIFFNIHDIHTTTVDHKQLRRIAGTTELLLVDEVFMCTPWMIQGIYQLHTMGVKIIVAGDPWQLPSVNAARLLTSHQVLHHICGGRLFSMKENIRCTHDLSKVLSAQVESCVWNVPECICVVPADLSIRRHLTWTNACAQVLNDLVMKHEIRRQRSVLWCLDSEIRVCSGIRGVPHGAVCFTKGTPITLNDTCAFGVRNMSLILTSFTAEHVVLSGKRFALTKDFFELAMPSYAITIHKSQGSTICEPYQVHETERFCTTSLATRLLYVALTRCTTPSWVRVCRGCTCAKQKTRSYTRKMCALATA